MIRAIARLIDGDGVAQVKRSQGGVAHGCFIHAAQVRSPNRPQVKQLGQQK
ncbi:MAG: hypothetical protein SNJ57_11585 [Cyanobacteriota bacterium]